MAYNQQPKAGLWALHGVQMIACIGVALFLAVLIWKPDLGLKEIVEYVLVGIGLVLTILRVLRGSVKKAKALEKAQYTYILNDPTIQLPGRPVEYVTGLARKTEIVLRKTRQHPIHRIRIWIGAMIIQPLAVFALVSHVPIWIVGPIWVLSMLGFATRILEWAHNVLEITNIHIIEMEGAFTISRRELGLEAIRPVTIRISWQSRLLAFLRFIYVPYGRLIIKSAAEGGDVDMPRVPSVEAIWELLSKLTEPKNMLRSSDD